MVKIRDAGYCNLKLLLIFLVIYGHLVEPKIWRDPGLMTQYRWIYLVHMPLFAFLTGFFLDNAAACLRQWNQCFSLYLFLQTAAVFLGNGRVDPLTPYWHLWYLLSVSVWCLLGWLWFRFGRGNGIILLLAAIVIGCAVGYDPEIDREHSASRTLVFFPYFFAGLLCHRQTPWHKYRWLGLTCLLLTIYVMSTEGGDISAVFLYHAAPYGSRENGAYLRLICYFAGFSLGLFLLSFVPTIRLPFSKAGANTMNAYILHVPLVLWLRTMDIPWQWYPVITAAFLYMVHKITQWHQTLYGIKS